MAIILGLVGCSTSSGPPRLPSSTDAAAIADAVSSTGETDFLHDVTTYRWDDGGRQAGELFRWIPRDARSDDLTVATRAGETAQAIATYLGGEQTRTVDSELNPALLQSYSAALAPYLGAMVGDGSGVAGFEALDGLDSSMPHTVDLFASLSSAGEAGEEFTTAASRLAGQYEKAFAQAAAANPTSAASGDPERSLRQAARLRGLIASGAYVADPTLPRPTAARARTQLAYEVATITARAGDPTIDSRFFDAQGGLLPPDEIAEPDWNVYDDQLSLYLAPFAPINDQIRRYGRVIQRIATQQ